VADTIEDETDSRSLLIQRPNTLKHKVGDGGFDPAAVEAAEAAIAELASNYLEWALGDLERLRQALAKAQGDAVGRPRHWRACFDAAHDMKGQGGTFGYPLVSRVANSLCRYIERTLPQAATDFAIVTAHIDALAALLAHQASGDGGQIGQQIAQGLEMVVARAEGATKA
jgi:HPt (histidine-containing phosphotransfer) domain-containing protein